MIVIGCDPGKSFGVVVMIDHDLIFWYQGDAEHGISHIVGLLEAETLNATHTGKQPEPTVLVVEKFIITPGTGRKGGRTADVPVLVGELRALADQYEHVTYAEQTVSDATRGFPNALLRRLGLYILPRDVGQRDADDANSALRHCLLWLLRNRPQVIDTLSRNVSIV